MSVRWLHAPQWFVMLGVGLLTFVGMVAARLLAVSDDSVMEAVAESGLLAGLYGWFIGGLVHQQNLVTREMVRELTPSQQADALRAVRRGRVPSDSGTRSAAWRLAGWHRDRARRRHPWGAVLSVALAATAAAIALITGDFRPWVGTVVFLGFAVWQLRQPRRLDERVALLEQPERAESTRG